MTRVAEMTKSPEGRHAYGATSDYVGLATRPIRGLVRDRETGKSLAGVSVGLYAYGRGNVTVTPDTRLVGRARTDQEGRYELLGVTKAQRYVLEVNPADGPYFRQRLQLQDTPGLGALTGDIELTRGLTVRGRVMERVTGKPIAHAWVKYHPLAGNTFAAQVSGLCNPCTEVATGPDGLYVLPVLPGPGLIGVTGPRSKTYMQAQVMPSDLKQFFKTPLVGRQSEQSLAVATGIGSFPFIFQESYHGLVPVEPGEKEEGLVKNVMLEPALERQGRVLDPDGQPLTGVSAEGLVPSSLGAYDRIEILKGPEFTVRGLNPRANRPLVFYQRDKNLSFVVNELRGQATEPLTVTLHPCGSVSGRIVDQDGQPVAGLRLSFHGVLQGRSAVNERCGGYYEVTTTSEGRFHLGGLVPGLEYIVQELTTTHGMTRLPHMFPSVQVEPGKHRDMGNLKMKEAAE